MPIYYVINAKPKQVMNIVMIAGKNMDVLRKINLVLQKDGKILWEPNLTQLYKKIVAMMVHI